MTLQPRSLVRILIYRTWTIQNELKLLLAPYKQIFLNSLGNFSNNDGDGYENVTWKWIRATSNFIELRKWNYFHVVVVQRRQRNVQKSVMHVQSCCFANLNLLLFCRSRWRRRRRCLSSLLSLPLRGLFKVMLHETIRNNDFQRNTVLQCWNNVATIWSNVATML